jgi:hypothetical protein
MGVFSKKRSDHKLLMTFYRPWYKRPIVLLFVLLPILGLARLALTPLAWYQTQRALAQLPEYDISFSSMSLGLFSKQVVFRNVQVHHRGDDKQDDRLALATIPFVQIDGPVLRWLRGGPIEEVSLLEPIFRLRTHDHLALSPQARSAWEQAASRWPLTQIKVLHVHKGALISEVQAQGKLSAYDRPLIREMDLTIKGLGLGAKATSDTVHAKLNGGLFLGSGIITGDATLKPDGARSWDFKGELFVAGLDLPDVYGHTLAPEVPKSPPLGKLRVKATFEATRGLLTANLESEAFTEGESKFTNETLAALEQKIERTAGMSVWSDGKRVQAALPSSMAPIRLAATVPTLVLTGARHALTPPPEVRCLPRLAQLVSGGAEQEPGAADDGTADADLPTCPEPEEAAQAEGVAEGQPAPAP